MTGQLWRKALWHLRHGGFDGLRRYREKVRLSGQPQAHNSRQVYLASSDQHDTPQISVIVPAYNASDFIGRCLRSILDQTGVALEVIVIDDGSTDDTAAVVAEMAKSDVRVSLVRGDNKGPAEARNVGVRAARGTFIAFADADDEVLPGAYRAMVDSLDRTGSDIVTGSYVRVGSVGRSRPRVSGRVHARQRLAVRIDDMPELLEEPVLWNKVYRREFWKRHVGDMRTFENYEDQEPVYRALISAAAIDVLTRDVYSWRMADGRHTRSRRKAKHSDLRARLNVIDALANVLEYESELVRDRAYATWMGRDLAMHAEYLDAAPKKFRKSLMLAASQLQRTMPRDAWNLIPTQERLLMWVVAGGHWNDIEEILGTRAEETTAVPLECIDGRWFVTPTYVKRLETRIPKRLLRARAADFLPQVIIRNARWVEQDVIELQGCAYLPGINPADVDVHIQGVMDGAVVLDVPIDSVNDNRIDLEVGDPWRSYGQGGFKARIGLEDLSNLSPRGIDLYGRFDIEHAQFHTPAKSTAVVGMIAPSPVVHGARVTVVADEHEELSIRPVVMPEFPVLAKRVTAQGRDITVTLDGAADATRLELHSAGRSSTMIARSRSIFTGTLPELPDRFHSGGERLWMLSAETVDGREVPVHHEAVDYLLPDTSSVCLSPNIGGEVRLSQRFRRVTVTGATNDRDRLLVTGRIDPPEKLSIVLHSSDQTFAPVETARHADGGFTTVYDLTTEGAEGGKVAAMSGGYHVRYGSSPESATAWARVAGKLAIRPVDCFTEWNTLRIEGRDSGAVAITASPPWSSQERTKCGRFALRDRDWGPLTKGILFESYNGKTANDNPRALFDAIRADCDDIPLYWSVRDRRVDVPKGSIAVVEGTAEWHKALATSRVWINNNNFPYYVIKKPGQFYLQTWHGTPNKKLLWDLPREKVPITYRRLMASEVAQWDLLLAQSESASDLLRNSLGYTGPTRIMEYPRNLRLLRSLVSPESIRNRLGLAPNKRVLLYAPTWRDQHRQGGALKWDDTFDFQAVATLLNAQILVRSHHMTQSDRIEDTKAIDVSAEAHIEDILAVSDIVITDYSSISYDYSITGRPIVYYLPDLKDYGSERGMYPSFDDHLRSGYIARNRNELFNSLESAVGMGASVPTRRKLRQLIDNLNVEIGNLSTEIISHAERLLPDDSDTENWIESK